MKKTIGREESVTSHIRVIFLSVKMSLIKKHSSAYVCLLHVHHPSYFPPRFLPVLFLLLSFSLGQNFLTDQNTINRIVNSFSKDATRSTSSITGLVELGPGPGALTQLLISKYGTENFRCIEIDQRSVELLNKQYPELDVRHMDVLQVDYPGMKREINGEGGEGLAVIGNLPYYITSQILFALADAR